MRLLASETAHACRPRQVLSHFIAWVLSSRRQEGPGVGELLDSSFQGQQILLILLLKLDRFLMLLLRQPDKFHYFGLLQ